MNRALSCAVALAALLLAACEQKHPAPSDELQPIAGEEPPPPRGTQPASPTPVPPSPVPPNPAVSPDAVPGENDGRPVIAPATLTLAAARSETGARANILAWARGIELREFDQAWALMGDAAKAELSKQQFNALFHPLRDLAVTVPAGRMEGAAGSTYYTVPATVTGARSDGSRATLTGDVILRRVNDIDGATREQLAWKIVSMRLSPV